MRSVRTTYSGVLTLAGALATSACIPTFDDDQSLVESVRVLAVRAEPAEPKPSETVTLRALVAGPAGETLAIDELTWSTCHARKALTELGPIAPECIDEFGDKRSEALTALGKGESVTTTIRGEVCRVFGPLEPPPAPGSTESGRPFDPDTTGGYYQPFVLGWDDPSTASVRLLCGPGTVLSPADSRLFNLGYRPNENPSIAAVHAVVDGDRVLVEEGAALQVPAGATVMFEVSWPECPSEAECGDGLCTAGENATECPDDCRTDPVSCAGSEVYLVPNLETRRVDETTEELRVAWFANDGTFDIAQTGASASSTSSENSWTAPDRAKRVSLWLVLRDDRGGVDFRSVSVDVTR